MYKLVSVAPLRCSFLTQSSLPAPTRSWQKRVSVAPLRCSFLTRSKNLPGAAKAPPCFSRTAALFLPYTLLRAGANGETTSRFSRTAALFLPYTSRKDIIDQVPFLFQSHRCVVPSLHVCTSATETRDAGAFQSHRCVVPSLHAFSKHLPGEQLRVSVAPLRCSFLTLLYSQALPAATTSAPDAVRALLTRCAAELSATAPARAVPPFANLASHQRQNRRFPALPAGHLPTAQALAGRGRLRKPSAQFRGNPGLRKPPQRPQLTS